MKREEDLIKTRHIPFVGGEFYSYPRLSEPGLKLSSSGAPERKSSPSCRLLTVAAAHRRLSPLLPSYPRRAERTSATCSGAPEQLIHHGSLTGSRSGRLLCYTQRENLRGLCLQSSHKEGFGCKWTQECEETCLKCVLRNNGE